MRLDQRIADDVVRSVAAEQASCFGSVHVEQRRGAEQRVADDHGVDAEFGRAALANLAPQRADLLESRSHVRVAGSSSGPGSSAALNSTSNRPKR